MSTKKMDGQGRLPVAFQPLERERKGLKEMLSDAPRTLQEMSRRPKFEKFLGFLLL